MPKLRADLLLVEQGLAESRGQAQKLIMAGLVRATADHVVQRSSDTFESGTLLSVDQPLQYVSRGAEKLLPALERHLPDLTGLIGLDIGASTGGFTDLMLQRGAVKVYAVDAGHGQLHWKLRQDPRVINLENTNARYLSTTEVPEPAQVLTMDVSFISVTKVLPAAAALLASGAWAFVLVKPQFEAERHEIAKGGVVRDDTVRERVAAEVSAFVRETLGWQHLDTMPSPIAGPKGNREIVIVCRHGASPGGAEIR